MQTLLTKQNVGAVMLAGAISDERLQLEVLSALGNAAEKLLAGNSSGSSNVGCWSGAVRGTFPTTVSYELHNGHSVSQVEHCPSYD